MAGREMVLKKLRKSRLMQVQPSGWAGLGLGLGLGSGGFALRYKPVQKKSNRRPRTATKSLRKRYEGPWVWLA